MSNETKIPLFRRFVIQNFPYIEQDFDALTDYQLISKVVEYLNMVIEQTNQSTEQVAVLTDSFNQLKDYVDHYFDNLDVQEEINNKLDAMVEDGTMASLINPILDEFETEIRGELEDFEAEVRSEVNTIGDVSELETVNKNTIVAGVNCANENYCGLLREKYGNNYRPVNILENESFFTNNVVVYKDVHSNNYTAYCNLDAHKNTGGNDIFVDPSTSVPSGQQDGTEEKPYNKISSAYAASSNGDTIKLASGFYNRTDTGNFNLVKSVNIVAKDGEENKVFCACCDSLAWTQNDTYTNVYQATRSNTRRIIDIRKRSEGIFAELPLAESLEACSNTLNSCYISGSTIYANIGEAVTNDNIAALIQVESLFRIANSSADTNVYFENITFLSGYSGFVSVTGSGAYDCMFTAKNCNFYYSYGTANDALPIVGANSILYNCKACFADKDGFNYHASGDRYCKNIEINCVGANNGAIGEVTTYNGSTTHQGNKILRINGVYFNNHGANVCDVGTGTLSINIGCKSFDSICAVSSAQADFNAQQAGTTMKLYNCYSKGSRSRFNIYAVSDTTIDVYNCQFDRTGGDGTITIH